jgi:hypothetical protein
VADEERTEPYVKITRAGRWLYEVNLMMPLTGSWITMTNNAPWLAFGRRHAEWLGDRKLRKYIRREAWRSS